MPLAIAEAFRSGNLGIMDYYQYKNIQADTDMRSSISRSTGESGFWTRCRLPRHRDRGKPCRNRHKPWKI